ncbi:uncharacterized protein TRUGW13939_10572 [Talaromyces rugulosus]|uniref:Uncharacterized protein n=1 Tax=Talaromyces rugulosus TaxID=121627 RepID=A0A7H8RAI6_TALRU|nr:uncharacterized protein TRUGW13939_10572 [Talaromyces rugulosus]QKX63402.1 hypothetical protein TRUGW13939_10572 [Talaromyces rugulosus]
MSQTPRKSESQRSEDSSLSLSLSLSDYPLQFKCDGNKPSCTRCLHRQLSCSYTTEGDNRGTAPKSYVRLLQARIELLERILRLHNIDIYDSMAELLLLDNRDISLLSATEQSTSSVDQLCTAFEGILSLDEALNFESESEPRFFGLTSGRLSFMAISNDKDNPHLSRSIQSPNIHNQALARENWGIPEELESHLLDLYFTWEQPWFQVVDEALFYKSKNNYGRFYSPLLLNCILAIASRYSDRIEVRSDPTDANTAGCIFLETAEVLLHVDLKSPTITTLQSLAILGVTYWAGLAQCFRSLLVSFQHALSGLSQILEQILCTLYSPKPAHGNRKRSFFDSCLLTLNTWHYDLSPELKPLRGAISTRFPQAYTLCMTYHTSVLLLAKPYLRDSQDLSQHQIDADSITTKAEDLYKETAKQICSLSEQYRKTWGSFRQSPITATHCTLSAALGLFRTLSQEKEKESVVDAVLKNFETCLKTLQELSVAWTPPRKYYHNLRRMMHDQSTADDQVEINNSDSITELGDDSGQNTDQEANIERERTFSTNEIGFNSLWPTW